MATNSCALHRTHLATCSLASGKRQYLFFQDHDGGIRYLHCKEDWQFRGGDKTTRILVANNAKWYSPLAAVGYGVSCENQECSKCWELPKIHLFYLNAENFIRCVKFDGITWDADIDFNKALVRAHPSSKLSVVKEPSDTSSILLRLFYQSPEQDLRECIHTGAMGWSKETKALSTDLLIGSYISATAVHDEQDGRNDRQIWACYQSRANGHLSVAYKGLSKTSNWGDQNNGIGKDATLHTALAAIQTPNTQHKYIPSFVFSPSTTPGKLHTAYSGYPGVAIERDTPDAIPFTNVAALAYKEGDGYYCRVFYQGMKNQLYNVVFRSDTHPIGSQAELSTPP